MAQKTRPNPTQFRPLSVDQLNAIECLIAGQTDLEASAAVGVARTTISTWRHSPLFVSTLNARRAELWEVPQARLLALVNTAVNNIAGAVEAGDVKSSVELLKCIGLYGVSPTFGVTDPHTVLNAQAKEGAERDFPGDGLESLLKADGHPARYRREQELQAELWATYGSDDPMESR